MDKYYVEILVAKENHAGSKARSDAAVFLEDFNVTNLVIDTDISRAERILFLKKKIRHKLSMTKPGDMIIVSFPNFLAGEYGNFLLDVIKEKKLRLVFLIHDVESLRQDFTKEQVNQEIQQLNKADLVISHNSRMTEWLKGHGVTKHIVELELFDYYNTHPIKDSLERDQKVIFAGNLNKADFLGKLADLKLKMKLYGPNPSTTFSKNIEYMGSFPPSVLPSMLDGGFGLIWDGNSIEECSGLAGNYQKYNNPHKTSLYLSCGLPVVIWKEAALASFVEANHIGLCVGSLQELDQKLETITDEEYQEMKKNALAMAEKVRNGYFTKQAVKKAEAVLSEVNQ